MSPAPSGGAPALEVRALVAGYTAEVDILRGVSLDVRRGEIVTVLGPNGAGKSTLIKAIAGLVPVRRGEVLLYGRSLVGESAHRMVRRDLAYVPQTHNVFARLSIQENLELGACARDDRHAIEEDLDRMYALFPRLRERRRQAAGTLSGGERQMVALARALMARPTMLMVEQNAKAALAISDRGCVLAQGREQVSDAAAALLANPEVGALYLGASRGLT